MIVAIRAGEMRDRLAIARRSTSADAIGEPLDQWDALDSRWAKIEPLSNSNIELARGFAATVNYQATMRYYADVSNDCRVMTGGANGRTFYVDGVIHDPRKVWTVLFLSSRES